MPMFTLARSSFGQWGRASGVRQGARMGHDKTMEHLHNGVDKNSVQQ